MPYYDSMRESVMEQGLAFEPGLHTRWAFYGTSAVESVVMNPMAGFQPLKEGGSLGSIFGCGTYFARDAKFTMDAKLCGSPNSVDGTHKMLMCLVATGMPC